MSALGQKQSFAPGQRKVRFAPKAVIRASAAALRDVQLPAGPLITTERYIDGDSHLPLPDSAEPLIKGGTIKAL
jgi:hypothetical protein